MHKMLQTIWNSRDKQLRDCLIYYDFDKIDLSFANYLTRVTILNNRQVSNGIKNLIGTPLNYMIISHHFHFITL